MIRTFKGLEEKGGKPGLLTKRFQYGSTTSHRISRSLVSRRYLDRKNEYLVGLSRYIHLNPVRIKKYSQVEIEEKRKILKKMGSGNCNKVLTD